MVVFVLIFLTFSSQRVSEYRDYVTGSVQLSVPFGFFNTVILLTSSMFVHYLLLVNFIHLLHVLTGMSFIVINRRPRASGDKHHAYVTRPENFELFWHFVDLLWVFIYALLYLL